MLGSVSVLGSVVVCWGVWYCVRECGSVLGSVLVCWGVW